MTYGDSQNGRKKTLDERRNSHAQKGVEAPLRRSNISSERPTHAGQFASQNSLNPQTLMGPAACGQLQNPGSQVGPSWSGGGVTYKAITAGRKPEAGPSRKLGGVAALSLSTVKGAGEREVWRGRGNAFPLQVYG